MTQGLFQMDDRLKQEYRDAYQRWQRDLQRLHDVLLEGEPLDPMHRIALLRSESHSHDRYEDARSRLLHLLPAAESPTSPFGDDEP